MHNRAEEADLTPDDLLDAAPLARRALDAFADQDWVAVPAGDTS